MPEQLHLITPPATEPVTLAEVKAHLRVIDSGEDTLIAEYIEAARRHVESVLGRQLISASWVLVLDGFPDRPLIRNPGESEAGFDLRRFGINLMLAPLDEVTSINYTAPNGTATELDSSLYTVLPYVEPAAIVPSYGNSWPSTRAIPSSVSVAFTAGYANADAVPAPIKQYIKLLVGNMYAHREETIVGTIRADLGLAERLLDNWRVR